MSNPFDLDLDKENIPSTFITCVSCFDYALRGRTNDRSALQLGVLRLRLTRWGEAVNVYDDPNLGRITPKPRDFEGVKSALIKIIALFEEWATTVNEESVERTTRNQPTDLEQLPQALLATLEKIASERSGRARHPSLLEPRLLALGERSEALVEASSQHIGKLERHFPAHKRQRSLSEWEKKRIGNNLEYLEKAAIDLDPWMSPNALRANAAYVNAGVISTVVGGNITANVEATYANVGGPFVIFGEKGESSGLSDS